MRLEWGNVARGCVQEVLGSTSCSSPPEGCCRGASHFGALTVHPGIPRTNLV